MIRKDPKTRNGVKKTYITVVEGYRPGPGMPPKQRTVKSFGYLEDQADPAAFMKAVEAFDADYRAKNKPLRIEADGTVRMYGTENKRQNYGYKFLCAIYDMLQIDRFVNERMKDTKFRGQYSPAEIFRFLVLMRILSPDSKRASCQAKDTLYGMDPDFTLENVYRSLDQFANFEVNLQHHLNEVVKDKIGRDLSYAFYDVTNFFFETDFPNGESDLRQRGVSKEHRVDPIVSLGLFIDGNGLPVSMGIFPGNKSEKKTLEPVMKDIKKSYGLGRLVVVADKGLNGGPNIDMIVNGGDGFIFSQVLRGTHGTRYRQRLFDPSGWTKNADGSYMWKLFEEAYTGHDANKMKVVRKRKVLLYWNRADAAMAAAKREEKLRKAEKSVTNNAYGIKKGQDEYIKEDVLVKDTGEFLDAADVKKMRRVDAAKADVDAAYDGYFCIITSELDMSERQMRVMYGKLWRIEQSFRILKSDLYARPVYLWTTKHIRAHFLICFTALLVVRVLQHLMGTDALSAERIACALNAATCRVLRGGIVMLDDVGGKIAFEKRVDKHGMIVDSLEYSSEDEIAQDYKMIQDLFGTDIYNVYIRQEVFNKLLMKIAVP